MSNAQDGSQKNDETVSVLKPDERLKSRLEVLASHFRSRFHRDPSFFVRVPGRVNLIGEHVDYCGYPVLPMAIEQDILVAVCKSDDDDALRLTNVDGEYQDYEHKSLREIRESSLDIPNRRPSWYHYFLCGVKGALEVIPEDLIPKSLRVAVWGNIIPNAGLSSSSALVSAALLATVHASQHIMSKKDMATVSAHAERYIGTEGGGMDQAIAFLGKEGSAKLIEFNPLRGFDVKLPSDVVFVIADSICEHNKVATVDFNTRVYECQMAAKVIAKKRGIDWHSAQKLIDVQERLGKSLEEMVSIVTEDLHEEPYSLHELLCQILEEKEDSTDHLPVYKLRQRALHVFQEARRVAEFQHVCEREDIDEADKLRQLGRLMSESQSSLRDIYECSHFRIDALIDATVECGALGAKLSGAGWGGCIVAITTSDKVEEFIDNLKKKHYQNDILAKDLDWSNLVFKAEPKQGAAIYHIE